MCATATCVRADTIFWRSDCCANDVSMCVRCWHNALNMLLFNTTLALQYVHSLCFHSQTIEVFKNLFFLRLLLQLCESWSHFLYLHFSISCQLRDKPPDTQPWWSLSRQYIVRRQKKSDQTWLFIQLDQFQLERTRDRQCPIFKGITVVYSKQISGLQQIVQNRFKLQFFTPTIETRQWWK